MPIGGCRQHRGVKVQYNNCWFRVVCIKRGPTVDQGRDSVLLAGTTQISTSSLFVSPVFCHSQSLIQLLLR